MAHNLLGGRYDQLAEKLQTISRATQFIRIKYGKMNVR